ncbi:hypothetical protein BSL78_08993 [Apostichopus japonicus]|uniref:Brix domain-containing protein n=1 Tax=Stichopus japonicus TaxID=307972 RepID=A0A2G8L1H0_STIJA|nr:hypothetical protein BSL78_08993 [Apostichopus japonicus]
MVSVPAYFLTEVVQETGKTSEKKEKEELGDKAPPKQVPKTIESMRVFEETMVDPGDREVQHDEDHDEMAPYFKREVAPKVLITHSNRTVWRIRKFLRELRSTIPSSKVFRRKNIRLKRVIQQAISKDYTHVIVLHHDKTVPNGLIISQLPNGPTAHFRISNVRIRKEIKRCGLHTYHKPEVVLNNFGTRLGHRVGRLFATMFEQDPEFVGRQVVTFHNQRDYIFFRRHRYVFKKNMRVALQELGPRFTLKLRSLQKGTFDTKYGEYEFVHKKSVSRVHDGCIPGTKGFIPGTEGCIPGTKGFIPGTKDFIPGSEGCIHGTGCILVQKGISLKEECILDRNIYLWYRRYCVVLLDKDVQSTVFV